MGNINSTNFIFDDNDLDRVTSIEQTTIDKEQILSNVSYGQTSSKITYYEEKIKLLNEEIIRLENKNDDLFHDYSRLKIKYDSISKKLN